MSPSALQILSHKGSVGRVRNVPRHKLFVKVRNKQEFSENHKSIHDVDACKRCTLVQVSNAYLTGVHLAYRFTSVVP